MSDQEFIEGVQGVIDLLESAVTPHQQRMAIDLSVLRPKAVLSPAIQGRRLPFDSFCDAGGNPLVGGSVYVYNETLGGPVTTYTGADLQIQHTNPVILNAEGRPDSNNGGLWVYSGPTVRVEVFDCQGNLLMTFGGITP